MIGSPEVRSHVTASLTGQLAASTGPASIQPAPDKLRLWKMMVQLRAYDERATLLQRQGRIGAYPVFWGEEAIQAAAVLAVRSTDWLFPSYRQNAVPILRGLPPEQAWAYFRGDPHSFFDPAQFGCAPQCVPLATHLPHAVGWALGRRLQGGDDVALAFFGDGGSSEGDTHEAMNMASVFRAPVVFLCTNNQWAISTPLSRQAAVDHLSVRAAGYKMPGVTVDGYDPLAVFSAVAEAVSRARQGGGPSLVEASCYRIGPHATADDPSLYRDEAETAVWRQREPIARFEQHLLDGQLVSAQDVTEEHERVAEAMRVAGHRLDRMPAPTGEDMTAHVLAMPPSSWPGSPAPASVHGVMTMSRERPENALPVTLVEAVAAALEAELAADSRVVLLGEDIGRTGGVFRATAGLQARFGEKRVIDTPACEAGFVGASVGMCLAGLRPVVELQFDSFSYPAFEQIVCHVARYRWRTAGAVEMTAVLRIPYGGGTHAPELHSDSPEALFCHVPGLVVVTPSSPADAYSLLRWAIRHPDPVIFMEPKRLYRSTRGTLPAEPEPEGLPRARVVRPGTDVTIVSYGPSVPTCIEAADLLAERGTSAEILDLRALWPLDEEAILASVRRTRRCVVVHEAARSCGVGAEVAAVIAEHAIFSLDGPVVRVAGLDAPFPLFMLEDQYLPDPERIVAAVEGALR
jgi:2-oxoisovalerate dehydrogenase E1 component